jgi:hypothetical protein
LNSFYFGLDLGKRRDFMAMVGIQRIRRLADPRRLPDVDNPLIVEYWANFLEHMVGVSYTDQVLLVKKVLNRPQMLGQSVLIPDWGGVGEAVVEMLENAGLAPIPIKSTTGDLVSAVENGFHVPKKDLVGVVDVALGMNRVKIKMNWPDEAHRARAIKFKTELQNFRKVGLKAPEGEHDDFVMGFSMGLWMAMREGGEIEDKKPPDEYEDYNIFEEVKPHPTAFVL